jgi:DNA-binding winged helix-turn-helix (wHTH) protein
MESRPQPPVDACLRYDETSQRVVLVRGGERHELQLRAQGHRLVGHMARRNAEAGGSPVLCTHDELMRAVWADEPLHSREELAKLIWELRKKLEPYDAEHLIETERRRGYRLVTCAPGPPAATAARTRGRRPTIIAAAVAVALLAGAALVVAATRGSSRSDEKLATFVDRVENVLLQSAAGRREIHDALEAGRSCTIPPRVAGSRIASVADNRQSVLGQLGTLPAPTREADAIVTDLQRALEQSIEADRHYRDAFYAARPRPTGCKQLQGPEFALAASADAAATAAKRRVARRFDPLARRFHRKAWRATDF